MLLAARQCAGGGVAQRVKHGKHGEDAGDVGPHVGGCARPCAEPQIILDRKRREQLPSFRHLGDAERDAPVSHNSSSPPYAAISRSPNGVGSGASRERNFTDCARVAWRRVCSRSRSCAGLHPPLMPSGRRGSDPAPRWRQTKEREPYDGNFVNVTESNQERTQINRGRFRGGLPGGAIFRGPLLPVIQVRQGSRTSAVSLSSTAVCRSGLATR